MKQTTHLHLVLRLRICAATPPLHLYAFIANRENFAFFSPFTVTAQRFVAEGFTLDCSNVYNLDISYPVSVLL
jgi:hypothetical protein